jgi:cell wall-associated NlpC family hydrolase
VWWTVVLVALVGTMAAGCRKSGAVYRPMPPSAPGSTAPARLDGYALATAAMALQGIPYRLGGADPSGFDCSGLVQYVLREMGIAWPRVVHDQWEAGRPIDANDIAPGDLVFFVTEGRDVSHVGIAIGGDRFVHAPNSRGVVRVETLGSDYWSRRFAGARRVE